MKEESYLKGELFRSLMWAKGAYFLISPEKVTNCSPGLSPQKLGDGSICAFALSFHVPFSHQLRAAPRGAKSTAVLSHTSARVE